MKFKTVLHPHGKRLTWRECRASDIFMVSQGLQCGNCLALVQEKVPIIEDDENDD